MKFCSRELTSKLSKLVWLLLLNSGASVILTLFQSNWAAQNLWISTFDECEDVVMHYLFLCTIKQVISEMTQRVKFFTIVKKNSKHMIVGNCICFKINLCFWQKRSSMYTDDFKPFFWRLFLGFSFMLLIQKLSSWKAFVPNSWNTKLLEWNFQRAGITLDFLKQILTWQLW